MSTAKVSFAQLPEAGETKSGDFFVIEDVTQTKKINYKNIIFGLENVTFAATLSTQSTNIAALSSNIDSLSSQVFDETAYLTNLVNTTIQTTTAVFVNQLYPVNSIIYTATNVNPGVTLVGTQWQRVAQGLFLAGVGSGVDKNGTGFVVGEGEAASNFNAGEYNHTLTINEIASHTHSFQPIGETNASIQGAYVESAQGPGGALAAITSSSAGGNQAHNNIPPLFGVYVWKRVS